MQTGLARVFLVVALCAGIGAAQKPVASTPTDADGEIAALVREQESSSLGYVEKYAQWKPRFEAFAAAHRGSEAELTAQLWLLQQTWWLKEKGEMEKTSGPLVDDLLVRFPKSMQLAKIPEIAYVFDKKKKPALFEALLASPHAPVQAAAHLGFAKLNPPQPAWREKGEHDAQKEHPHLYALQAKFADEPYLFTTYGAIAESMLNPLTPAQLVVGVAAPEISGIDQDGKPMKLSDFRGKVVVLDFWGSW